MTVRDEEFLQWLDELKHVFMTGYGYAEVEAQSYVHDQGQHKVWRDYFDDGYTPRQTASEDTRAGL